MTKLIKLFSVGTLALAVGSLGMLSFADTTYKTPAEIFAGLTGKTVESAIAEKVQTGKTYGTLANEAGKLDAFEAEMKTAQKSNLEAQVKAGTLTQAKADEILKAIETNQANCSGTGTEKIGQKMGAKFGSNGTGQGLGQGQGQGNGQGRGGGRGMHVNQ